MNALRRLLTATHVDQHGRAVVDADKLAGALTGVEALIDRLVRRLATATGRPEGEIRLSEGLNGGPTPEVAGDGPSRRRPVSGALRAEITAVTGGDIAD